MESIEIPKDSIVKHLVSNLSWFIIIILMYYFKVYKNDDLRKVIVGGSFNSIQK